MRISGVHITMALLLFLTACQDEISDLHPSELRCEYLENPLAIDAAQPRLTWIVEGQGRARMQTAYRILVASSKEQLDQEAGDLWDSGVVPSDRTANVAYRGAALTSQSTCYWKVMTWDEKGRASEWSPLAHWSMGLLDAAEWKAKWIGLDAAKNDPSYPVKPWGNDWKNKKNKVYQPLPAPYFRKEFSLDGPITDAKVHASALGNYELYINGQRVGEDYFTPGWTEYRKRVYYNSYDVTDLLQEGVNTMAFILADGWYAGNVADVGQHYYGDSPRLMAQLSVGMVGGETARVVTDEEWKAQFGPIREADMQGGETYDARLRMEGWNQNGHADADWLPVDVSDSIDLIVEAYPGIPVRKTGEITPVAIFEQKQGVYIVDMGQNFAGWARLKVSGQVGDSVTMRFAEKLNADSSIHTRNLRTARATDTYVLSGEEEETWEPRFTYHGYQYIEVTGYPGELTKDKITGIVLHSDLRETGTFSCSNERINRIHQNIVWSQRSNYFDVPTDCPQRDERMGWTGDAQLFMPTASYNMDIAPFFKKWMVDVADGQYDDGRFPSTAPRVFWRVAAGWGDAGIICPWNLYQVYDDTTILASMYPNMRRWMDYLEAHSVDYVSMLDSYGDWQNVDSETPIDVIATAYFKRSSDLMTEISSLLGHGEDVAHYSQLSDSITLAFKKSFIDHEGHITGRTQTAYLMALAFDLAPAFIKAEVEGNLLGAFEHRDQRLSTGILGTSLLLPTLTDIGRLDLAYTLLLNDTFPSWGYQIDQGATTVWERWDSFTEADGFHEDSTNSLNHYAYGSIGEWMYSTIAGIAPTSTGYKRFQIHPRPGGGLTEAKASYRSIRGEIRSSWKIADEHFALDVVIPPNTVAQVYLPSEDLEVLREGVLPILEAEGVEVLEKRSGSTLLRVGSGSYHFTAPYNP